MSHEDSGPDYTSAPRDYAELFSTYYVYVCNLIRKHGIHPDNVEDVASEILLRFHQRGLLDKFRPDLVFVYDGKERPARFKSFLTKVVLSYCRGYLDKQNRLAMHEMLICDTPLKDPSVHKPAVRDAPWIEAYGPIAPDHQDDVLNDIVAEAKVAELRALLVGIERRTPNDKCDLLPLFDAAIAQIREFGEWNSHLLAAQFGVSPSGMHGWLWWLRGCLCQLTGRPLPEKRSRVVKPRTV